MKISPFVFLCNILTASGAARFDKSVIGDSCNNEVDYSYAFYTDDGTLCNSCKLCTGTRIGLLFDRKHKNFCITCDEAKGQCTTFQVTTTFENPWAMKFFSLISSDKITDTTDPSSVVLNGSMDGTTWTTLFSPDDYHSPGKLFQKREVKKTYVLDNNNKYSQYAIKYKLKKTSTTMHLGASAIMQVYIKECAASILSDFEDENILPYDIQTVIKKPVPISRQAQLSDQFIGCFKDNNNGARDFPKRMVDSDTNTCLQSCAKEGYEFMGRQWENECFCGSTYGKQGTSNSCKNCLSQSTNYGGSVNCVFTTSILTLTEFLPAKIQVKQGRTIGEISNPTPEWIISFGLRYGNDADLRNHRGILRFALSSSTSGCCNYGDRIPAFIGTHDAAKFPNSIHFVSGTTKFRNHWGNGGKFVMNKDYNIKAIAVGNRAELYVDGVRVVNLEQDKTIRPTYGKPLKVHAETQAAATSVVISNLIYTHVKNNPTKAPSRPPTKAPTSSDQPTSTPSRPPTKAPTSRQVQLSDRFIGCFKDSKNRDLPKQMAKSDTNTCLQACAEEGYKFMGRQFTDNCFCGSTYGMHGESNECQDCLSQSTNYGSYVNCVFTTLTLTFTHFSPAKIQVKQGQTIEEISNPTPEWIISFGLRFSNDVDDLRAHYSILRFAFPSSTMGGGKYGNRHPAFMTYKKDRSMIFVSGTTKNTNHYASGGNFVTNKDYNIKAVAVGKRAELYVDGVRVVNLEQDKTIRPTYGKPLKVHAETQYAATSAVISNLIYTHVKNNPIKYHQDHGSSGGAPFTDYDTIESLVQQGKKFTVKTIEIRAGSIIDKIKFTLTTNDTFDHGSSGGVLKKLDLDDSEFISKVEYTFGGYRDYYVLGWIKFTTSKGRTVEGGNRDGQAHMTEADKGYQIVGMHGRKGSLIDKLGFYSVSGV